MNVRVAPHHDVRSSAPGRSAPALVAARWGRHAVGVLAGAATGAIGLLYVVGSGALILLLSVWPRGRRDLLRVITAGGRRLVAVDRDRLARFFGDRIGKESPAPRRVFGYLVAHGMIGPVAALVLVAGSTPGILLALLPLSWYSAWLTGALDTSGYTDGVTFTTSIGWPLEFGPVEGRITNGTIVTACLAGWILVYLMTRLLDAWAALERGLGSALLGAADRNAMERRIVELTTSRTDVMDAIDEERRRIERDLHDGVQQRLVALAVLLGRVRRGPRTEPTGALLERAHRETDHALTELREVARRVYPSTLDHLGLEAALDGIAQTSSVPVELDYRLTRRPFRSVETAVYFVVREAVTNAVKHARATRIVVRVDHYGPSVALLVRDDGHGGADLSAGRGLSGLGRRVAALDGRFQVTSPRGDGTVINALLPLEPAVAGERP